MPCSIYTDRLCDFISEASVEYTYARFPSQLLNSIYSSTPFHFKQFWERTPQKEPHRQNPTERIPQITTFQLTFSEDLTMAAEFCRALLRTSNIVPLSDTEDQDCVICLQEIGKKDPDTGVAESQVRLPCEHVVGSNCITVWLRTNNSCPLCRRVFFPAHREQDLEDINVQNQEENYQDEDYQWEDEEEEEEQEGMEEMLLRNCQNYSFQLSLGSTTIRLAQAIIKVAQRMYPFCDAISITYDINAVRLVTVAIYIASHFTRHPRSPREICGVRDATGHDIRGEYLINCNHIRDSYRMIYGQMNRLINDVMLTYNNSEGRDRRLIDVIRESLDGRDTVWPSMDPHDQSDEYIENSRDIRAVRAYCDSQCARLQVPPLMVDLTQHIAANVIRAGFHACSHPEDSKHLSESDITRVSLYIASHLLGQPLPRRSLQDRIGIQYPDIRSTCIMVRDKCNPLVKDDFRGTRPIQLSWASLEADIGEESDDGRHEHHDEDATGMGAAPEFPPTATRTEQLVILCGIYYDQLRPVFTRTCYLSQRLAERFSSLKALDGRSLGSIAAACVFIACFCDHYHYHYEDLEAMSGVSVSSIYTTHCLIAQGIVLGRVEVQDIAESMSILPNRLRHTLPSMPVDYDSDSDSDSNSDSDSDSGPDSDS